MKVYELRHCEEYFMQESHGIYISRERAKQELKNIVLEHENIFICHNPDHYSETEHHGEIINRDGVIVTKDNLEEVLSGYGFYDLEHIGYEVWGIYEVDVIK